MRLFNSPIIDLEGGGPAVRSVSYDMLRHYCPTCGNEIFFNSFRCLACSQELSFHPLEGGFAVFIEEEACLNRLQHQVCNWRRRRPGSFCPACEANDVIPDLSVDGNLAKWTHLEASKRRLYDGCLRLGISLEGLKFRFVAPTPSEPALTGHCDGLITLNIGEADPATREQTRLNLNERFRTLIGHFRHELGHFYWEQQVAGGPALERFRELFGDEREDYQTSLNNHYSGATQKSPEHISVYASSHPWEDWAETFAHYLHLRDALETAQQFGFSPLTEFEFEVGIQEWIRLSVAFNEINRSMGIPDLYPFALTPQVVDKLRFVDSLVLRQFSI